MFLNELISSEKKAFMELAYLVAHVDGAVNTDEEVLLATYIHEMGLKADDAKPEGLSLEAILPQFECQRAKNIVFMELLGLVLADENYSEEERGLLAQIRGAFGISEEKYTHYKEWVLKIEEIYNDGLQLLNG